MNINVYLPDELGQWAKEAGINLSATLREGILQARRDAEAEKAARGEMAMHELAIEPPTGGDSITVRLHAKELAWDGKNQWLYLAGDGRVLVFDNDAQSLYGFDGDDSDPLIIQTDDTSMATWQYGDRAFYLALMRALGRDPIIGMEADA